MQAILAKKGKVSISFSNMIKRAYREQNNGHKISDSREALSWWRKQEDQALVDSFNQYLAPELDLDFNLYRTGEHIADFDSYKLIREVNEKDKALEYAEEIKYYDPNHVIDKDLYDTIIEKNDIQIEQENYQNEYQSLSFSVIDLDPKK
ncbi:hypothetical protein [Fructilactobacillus florum]|uniref:hypothetical protein n=1 Tax=Fructilactobacillus florum TaxID=640331 RepID=UPI0020930898|nr:hypothetical protein [Fructilactobacillus florum]